MQGTDINLEAEQEGMLGSTQQASTIAALPPERFALNRGPLEEKASRTMQCKGPFMRNVISP